MPIRSLILNRGRYSSITGAPETAVFSHVHTCILDKGPLLEVQKSATLSFQQATPSQSASFCDS